MYLAHRYHGGKYGVDISTGVALPTLTFVHTPTILEGVLELLLGLWRESCGGISLYASHG